MGIPSTASRFSQSDLDTYWSDQETDQPAAESLGRALLIDLGAAFAIIAFVAFILLAIWLAHGGDMITNSVSPLEWHLSR